jgi:hypothetical protein
VIETRQAAADWFLDPAAGFSPRTGNQQKTLKAVAALQREYGDVVRSLAPVVPIGLQVPSPLDELGDERLSQAGLRLLLKRDDLINPAIPGNKWRKLKHNLLAARDEGHDALLTFGGAYSNHIRATAAAGHHYG